MAPAPSLLVLASLYLGCGLSVEIAVLNTRACHETPYSRLICEGVAVSRTTHPGDHIYFKDVLPEDCVAFAANRTDHQLMVFADYLLEGCAVSAAIDHPSTWIITLDYCPRSAGAHPNLICGIFAADQPSYAAGFLAGSVSSSKVAGIVGGPPIPPVQQLFNAFLLGVRASCPDCRVEGMYVNSFFHPRNAAAVASYLVNSTGADVVYGCGGGTGSMAIRKAAELGSMVVGVDVDEFESTFLNAPQEQRARVVTSVLKQVGVAVRISIELLKSVDAGSPVPELRGHSVIFDYTNSGVGLADCHLSCTRLDPSVWTSVHNKEQELAMQRLQIDLGDEGYSVPLLPESTPPNTFCLAPNPTLPPPPRIQATMAAFNSGGVLDLLVLFGGRNAGGEVLGDLWLYNIQSAKWLESEHGMTVGMPPPPLAKACAVALRQTVFIFGGRTDRGTQSAELYAFSYQPAFLGFSDPTSAFIRHEWAELRATGDLPLPVEGPGCAPFNATCGVVFGGRAWLQSVNTVHLFCVNGAQVHWTQLHDPSAGPGAAPLAREQAGVAVVDATALGLGAGTALVAAGGWSNNHASAEVWLLPLDGQSSWVQLADLPQVLMTPLVFATVAASGSHVLVVQPSSALPRHGFSAFTYDSLDGVWHTQMTSFRDATREETSQAIMVNSSGHLWAFGGTVRDELPDGLFVSQFKLQIKCAAGLKSEGVGCIPCAAGNYSRGGVNAVCLPCPMGKYAAASGTSECTDCAAGQFGEGFGQSECQLCPVGKFKGAGSMSCSECPKGSCNPSQGSTSSAACVPCMAGRYTNITGCTSLASCTACESGRALEVPFGQGRCQKCDPGRFAGGSGWAQCKLCPQGTHQPSQGHDRCLSCSQVLEGSTTEVLGSVEPTQCVCQAGRYRESNESSTCKSCVEGMSCPVGSDMQHFLMVHGGSLAPRGPMSYPLLQPRYWSAVDDPLHVFRCMNEHVCPGGEPGTCGNAKTYGIACGVCKEDFYMSRSGCTRCNAPIMNKALFPALPAILLPLVICLLYYLCRDMPAMWGTWKKQAGALFFLLWRYFQVVTVLIRLDLQLPSSVGDAAPYLESSLDFVSIFNLECAGFHGFESSLVIRNLTPVVFFFAGIMAYLGSHQVARLVATDVAMEADGLVNVLFSVMYSCFTGIASTSLDLFRCQLNPNLKRTLVRDPSIICWERVWNSMLGIGIAAVLVYCVGTLILFGHIVWVAPRRFMETSFQKRWKFLFMKCTPAVYWWSIMVLLESMLLNLCGIVFVEPFAQLTWIQAVQMLFLAAIFLLMPWRARAANVANLLSHISIILLVYVLSWTAEREPSENLTDYIIAFFSLPFVFTPIIAAYYILPRAMLARRGFYDGVTDGTLDLVTHACRMYGWLSRSRQREVLLALGENDVTALCWGAQAVWEEMTPPSLDSNQASRRLVLHHFRPSVCVVKSDSMVGTQGSNASWMYEEPSALVKTQNCVTVTI